MVKRLVAAWRRAGEDEGKDTEKDKRTADEGAKMRLTEKQKQWLTYLVLLLAVGVVLLSLGPRPVREAGTGVVSDGSVVSRADSPAAGGGAAVDAAFAANYARKLEEQVRAALMRLRGVNEAHVSVTLATGPEKVLAEQKTAERRVNDGAVGDGDEVTVDERTSAQPVFVRTDQGRHEQPIILMEHMPQIQGVVVVTDGANDSRLRYEISRAVATLLGLPAHQVYVLPENL